MPLPQPHPNQQIILNSNARFRVVACGRRFGKTMIGLHEILLHAGERGHTCWWLAPTYDMAAHVWRDLKAAVAKLPGVTLHQTDLRIEFPGGGSIEVHSAHTPDHLRGPGLDFVVLDEAAFMPASVWPEVIRPMLVHSRGAALFLSTPNGKNWFYDLFRLGLPNPTAFPDEPTLTSAAAESVPSSGEQRTGLNPALPSLASNITPLAPANRPISLEPEPLAAESAPLPRVQENRVGELEVNPPYASFHFPTAANPLIAPEELAAIRRETPEYIWQSEYLAEFTDNLGQVFRGIREAATAPLQVTPDPDARYVVGMDWGKDYDYSALVTINANTRQVVAVERFNQVSWALQRGRLKALCDRWNPRVIYAEENSFGSPNIEALQREGFPVRAFKTSPGSKPALIDALSLAIERQHIALQPHEALLHELAAYRLQRLTSGGYSYSAPSGQHDDLVIALALAYYASQRSGLPILSADP